MIRVGITGGIGSGKSTVARLFAARGIPVYDSDLRAKSLMNDDPQLRAQIESEFGSEAYSEQGLNRALLAQIVFSDSAKLLLLNSLVHPRVMTDLDEWVATQHSPYVLVESAILFESGFAAKVDVVLCVSAPLDVRVARVCRRDGSTAEAVRRRIESQMSDEELLTKCDYVIRNEVAEDLPRQIDEFEKWLKNYGRH